MDEPNTSEPDPEPAFDLAAHCRRIAALGGRATVVKYGGAHMREIGQRGFRATLERSGYSDAGHLISHWIELGRFRRRGGAT